MAQFTARSGVNSFFNVDTMSFNVIATTTGGGCGGGLLRFTEKLPIRYQKRKIRFGTSSSSSSRIYNLSRNNKSSHDLSSSSSSSSNSSSGDEIDFDVSEDVVRGVYDDYKYDDDDVDDLLEYENDDLSCFRGLVLDVAYRPINVVCWKRAICLEFMEKADVLEYYDQTVNSTSGSFNIPAVLRVPHLMQFVKRRRVNNVLSRKNILQRDNFTCQYCCSHENLTIDHVLPIARGGEWTWENLVTACSRCNSRKGRKTPEEANMTLLKTPVAPKDYDILAIPLTSSAISTLKLRKGTPEEWQQYLSKSSSQP